MEAKKLVKKAAKIAGVTCVAAGAVALMSSAAAIKGVTAGGKYLKDTVKKVLKEEPAQEEPVEEVTAEVVTEEAAVEETPAEETVEEVVVEESAEETV